MQTARRPMALQRMYLKKINSVRRHSEANAIIDIRTALKSVQSSSFLLEKNAYFPERVIYEFNLPYSICPRSGGTALDDL